MMKDGRVLFASEDDVKVPQHQHVLKFHRCVSSGYTCDVCRRHFSNGDITYDCRSCDFDACLACASKYFPQPVKGKTPTVTAGSMTALEQGMLCRITAVPERELASGIVEGDTVRILSIDNGEYHIKRVMANKTDTTAYCSAGLLVPLDKTASNPAAGSRPHVGQSVRIVGGEHRMGETGTLIEDDGSGVPFEVKFSDSDTSWFVAENVALAGPPENVEGELRQRPSRRSSFGAGEDESVDSDYDNDEDAFADLGLELLSGRLKLAKVHGQEEPPAAEDELEWETRYFVLYDTRKMCHFDGMQNGEPVGDWGLIDLDTIKTVEKVLGVPTFVMKGDKKVYLFKLEPHDEVKMRNWIGAITVELSASS